MLNLGISLLSASFPFYNYNRRSACKGGFHATFVTIIHLILWLCLKFCSFTFQIDISGYFYVNYAAYWWTSLKSLFYLLLATIWSYLLQYGFEYCPFTSKLFRHLQIIRIVVCIFGQICCNRSNLIWNLGFLSDLQIKV